MNVAALSTPERSRVLVRIGWILLLLCASFAAGNALMFHDGGRPRQSADQGALSGHAAHGLVARLIVETWLRMRDCRP
jgi:hypothetical protein